MASPSRITTRSTPRTSRALAEMPSRRATPTSASAASGPGQVTSSADDRPGSVSEPWARKAPRQAATASHPPPETTAGRQPADRAAARVEQAGLPGQGLAVLDHPDDVAAALAQAAALHHHDVGLVAVDLGDVPAQPSGGGAGVELGLDDDLAADDVQPAGEPQHRGDLGLAAAGLGDLGGGELCLHLCRHRHAQILACRSITRGRPPSDGAVRRGQLLADRAAADPSAPGDVGDHQPRPAGRPPRLPGPTRSVDRGAVGEHGVDGAGRGRARAARRGGPRARSRAVSPAWPARLRSTRTPAAGPDQRVAQLGHQQVRDHRGEPRARARARPSRRRAIACTASGQAGGSAGSRRDRRRSCRSVVATSTWPRTVVEQRPGSAGSSAAHLGADVQRRQRHRQHPAACAEQPADPVEALDRVAEQLPQPHDQQVADRVPAQLAVAVEAVLHHPRPGAAPLVVPAQGGQGHPQVAGRQHAELVAQPSRRAAVVGHGDDRGEVVDDADAARTARRAGRARRRGATDPRTGDRSPSLPSRGRGASARASYPRVGQARDDLLGHRDAAVLAAGAADGDRHEALALARGSRRRRSRGRAGTAVEERRRRPAGRARSRRRRRSRPVCGAQLGDPVRVGQEAHVGHAGRRRPGCRT